MDLERIPTVEKILAAADVLSEVGKLAGSLPDDRQSGAVMFGHLTIAMLYLAEYSKHLVDGMEPYDALLATARGELPLSQQQKDLWKALRPLRED